MEAAIETIIIGSHIFTVVHVGILPTLYIYANLFAIWESHFYWGVCLPTAKPGCVMLFVAIKFHCKSFVLPAAWNRQVIPHLLCQNKVTNSLFGFMLSKSSLTKQIVGKFGQVIASTKWTLKCAWSCTGIASVDRVLDLFKVSGAILSCQTWDLASMTFTCITSYVCWLCAVSHWKHCDEHNIGCMGPNWAEEYLVSSPDHTLLLRKSGSGYFGYLSWHSQRSMIT